MKFIKYILLLLILLQGFLTQLINKQIGLVLSNILQGPLKDNHILAIIDVSAFKYVNESTIALPFKDLPVYMLWCNNSEDLSMTSLHSSRFQENNIAVVLVVGDFPKWLDDEDIPWAFNTVLICNVNPELNSKEILRLDLIQRSENIALIEPKDAGRNQTGIGIFSSTPFLKSSGGQRVYKLFLGIWKPHKFKTFEDLFPDRFPSFNGEVLHVSSDSDDFPFAAIDDEDKFYGLTITILDVLGSVLDFTYTTTFEADDLNWGEKTNGTWNGLLKELITRNKNLTINYFTFTYDRSQDFDFSTPYFYEGFGFALRMPLPLPLWMNLIFPLSLSVWAGILLTIILFPIVFYGVSKLSTSTNKLSLGDSYFDVFRSLMRQDIGDNTLPTEAAGKICILFWLLGALIISTSYTGNLVAVLTIPVFPPKISSITELAKSEMGVSMVDYGEFVPYALKRSKDSVLKALGDKMTLVPWVDEDEEEAYRQMINNHLLMATDAAIETYSYLVQLIHDDEIAGPVSYILRDQIYTGPLVFYFPKHSPWHRRFDGFISRLVESGLITKWYNDLMQSEVTADGESSSSDLRSLTLNHLQGPFLVLIIGLALAVIVFLGELAKKREIPLKRGD